MDYGLRYLQHNIRMKYYYEKVKTKFSINQENERRNLESNKQMNKIISKIGYILTTIDNKHLKYNNIEKGKEVKLKNSSSLKTTKMIRSKDNYI